MASISHACCHHDESSPTSYGLTEKRFSKFRKKARDDYEPSDLADRAQRDIDPTHFEHKLASRLFRAFIGIRLNTHQLAAASEVLLFRAIREKPDHCSEDLLRGQGTSFKLTEKLKLVLLVCLLQIMQEQPAKQSG